MSKGRAVKWLKRDAVYSAVVTLIGDAGKVVGRKRVELRRERAHRNAWRAGKGERFELTWRSWRRTTTIRLATISAPPSFARLGVGPLLAWSGREVVGAGCVFTIYVSNPAVRIS